MIFRDAPAQVNGRGRRRDGGSNSRSFAERTFARRAVVKTKDGESGPPRGEEPADLILWHLADALGMSAMVSQNLLGAAERFRGAVFFATISLQ